jgi:uncharacterized membrane protein YkoI
MKRWYLGLGLVFVLATSPVACGRDDDDEGDEASEAAEKAETAAETPEAHAALLARAKVDSVAATRIALGRVEGTVEQVELEEEDGKLIWSFDIKVAGQEGVEEVHVDAMTGEIVKTEHESEEQEADEAKEGR